MNAVMALAADAAAGGAVTQTFLLADGRSVVGLDLELGIRAASLLEMAVTAWIAALAVCAYLHAASFEFDSIFPKNDAEVVEAPVPIDSSGAMRNPAYGRPRHHLAGNGRAPLSHPVTVHGWACRKLRSRTSSGLTFAL